MGLMRGAFAGVGALFRDSARVLVQVGPNLVALFLAGASLRAALLWLAVNASELNSFLGALIVPLAPLATLCSLVLMLRVAGRQLPAFAAVDLAPPKVRLRDDFVAVAIALIPFLAVYSSQGLLRQDVRAYIYDVTAAESQKFIEADYGRAVYELSWLVVAIIVGALVARKLISHYKLVDKHWGWAMAAAYLEALWLVTFAQVVAAQFGSLVAWVMSRQVVVSAIQAWDEWVDTLGAVAGAVRAIPSAIGSLVSMVGAVVTMPVAWLAIGALVFGAKLVGPKPEELTSEALNKRAKAIPKPLRRGAAKVLEPVAAPVRSTWVAIKKIAVAGVGTMVLFCISFYLAVQAQVLLRLLVIKLVGPRPWFERFALEPYLTLLDSLVYWVLIVVLLVAAVNAVSIAQGRAAAEPKRQDATANSTT